MDKPGHSDLPDLPTDAIEPSDEETGRDTYERLRESFGLERPPGCSRRVSLTGQTLDGKFRLEEKIGEGGMGLVYLATQENLDRRVVVKVLPPRLTRDEEAQRRFRREARGLSNLQHPNVVTIHDFGTHDDVPYIVMEFVEGETLGRRLAREGRLELDSFLEIALQVLEGLAAAHDTQLIHRDLKPANVMLCERRDESDFVKLLDFGLAKLAHDDRITRDRDIVGTVSYMAPEYILGDGIDARADVYAAGILFYQMLSGRKPFEYDDQIETLDAHIREEPTPLGSVLPRGHRIPRKLIHFIRRCLAKDPDKRPRDAGAVADWLRNEFDPRSRAPARSSESPFESADSRGSTIEKLPTLPKEDENGDRSATVPGDAKSASASDARLQVVIAVFLGGCAVAGLATLRGAWQESPEPRDEAAETSRTEGTPPDDRRRAKQIFPAPARAADAGRAQSAPVFVKSHPAGELYLDDRHLGATPLDVAVEPGNRRFEIRVDGETRWQEELKLSGGKPQRIEVWLPGDNSRPSSDPTRSPRPAVMQFRAPSESPDASSTERGTASSSPERPPTEVRNDPSARQAEEQKGPEPTTAPKRSISGRAPEIQRADAGEPAPDAEGTRAARGGASTDAGSRAPGRAAETRREPREDSPTRDQAHDGSGASRRASEPTSGNSEKGRNTPSSAAQPSTSPPSDDETASPATPDEPDSESDAEDREEAESAVPFGF